MRKRAAIPMLMFLLLFPIRGWAAGEVEVDPFAYALEGYSLHLILAGEQQRFDMGVFALELPEDADNPNYTVYFEGAGVKWDFNGSRIDGTFWGFEYASSTLTFRYDDPSDASPSVETIRQLKQFGVRLGYRFGKEGWYVSPWIGVSKGRLSEPVVLNGQPYQFDEWFIFPTIHIGYRF